MILLNAVPRVVKGIKTESRMMFDRLGEGRRESYCLMRMEFQFGKMKNI